MNTRNFRVRGSILSMFTPSSGVPGSTSAANLQVELWHKGPMEVVFLGSGNTSADGEFTVDFSCESPSAMIVDGKISDVFVKVYCNNQLVAGGEEEGEGSFD